MANLTNNYNSSKHTDKRKSMYFDIGELCWMTYIWQAVTRFIGHQLEKIRRWPGWFPTSSFSELALVINMEKIF